MLNAAKQDKNYFKTQENKPIHIVKEMLYKFKWKISEA